MPAEETRPARALIRERARSARQGLAPQDRTRLSAAACERLLAALPTPLPAFALGYVATSEELDPAAALDALREAGCRIAYPRVTGPGALSIHTCGPDELEPGPHGIIQPCELATTVRADQIALVIVPGVAFDTCGNRLGYGGGYYDRLLATMPHARKIGVCFDGQVVPQIPTEPHDIRMHALVTPARTIRI